jgi:DNA-binding transcriptional MerR regulator
VRHYEEQGLIAPGRDGQNRRVYDANTRARLEMIARLRAAGLGLAEIRDVLQVTASGGEDGWRSRSVEHLQAFRQRLRAQLVQVDSALEWLRPAVPSQRRFGVLI